MRNPLLYRNWEAQRALGKEQFLFRSAFGIGLLLAALHFFLAVLPKWAVQREPIEVNWERAQGFALFYGVLGLLIGLAVWRANERAFRAKGGADPSTG
jgi:hypothetical protein